MGPMGPLHEKVPSCFHLQLRLTDLLSMELWLRHSYRPSPVTFQPYISSSFFVEQI